MVGTGVCFQVDVTIGRRSLYDYVVWAHSYPVVPYMLSKSSFRPAFIVSLLSRLIAVDHFLDTANQTAHVPFTSFHAANKRSQPKTLALIPPQGA